jgi:hypothetical protein
LTRAQVLGGAGRIAAASTLTGGLDGLLRAGDALADGAGHGTPPVWRYQTRLDLRPPRLQILRAGPTGHGHLFLAPSSGPGQRGVLILDSDGEVVYFHPTTPSTAMNFRAARYHGKPVLTWWEGKTTAGLGTGTHVILDDTYRVVARVPAGHGRQSDLHEFLITPRNTALVTSYEVRNADLTSVGGPSGGKVIGGVVQELALPSGRVLFEWRSLDHVAIAETHAAFIGHPLDYFHVNSIDLTGDGHYLVSARNTWAVYKVNRHTGRVMWRLGGKRSDFEMGPGTVFAWQHDARHYRDDVISIFDDGAAPQVEPQSRALLIALDGKNRRAHLVRKYTHRPGRIVSRFMGNAQVQDNGNVLVGWGSEPYVTEFASDGSISFDAKLPKGGQNYRALRFPWVGRPSVPPAIRATSGHLYVSWNGSTETVKWLVEAGNGAAQLAAAQTVPKQGFETKIPPPSSGTHARVVALDAHGRRLGTSKTVRIRS